MVTKFGMGRDPEAKDAGLSGRGTLSFLVARSNGSLPSEVQAAATRAIRDILDTAYEDALETLVVHMATLRRIAAYLVEHERVDGDTFEELFEGRLDHPAAAGEWRPHAARPRDWGDIVPFREGRQRPAVIPVAAAATVPVTFESPASGGAAAEAAGAVATIPEPPAVSSIVALDAESAEAASVADVPIVALDPVHAPVRSARRAGLRPGGNLAIRALTGPAGRRVRRVAAGWLHQAAARLRPAESDTKP
jgi:hypothetical protein